MPRRRKPDPTPERRTVGTGSVSFDKTRQQYRARTSRGVDGRRQSVYFGTRAEAELWLMSTLARADGSFDPSRPLGEYLNYWYRLQLPRWKPLQARKVRSQLGALVPIAATPLDRVRADRVQDLLTTMAERGVSGGYIHSVGRLLYRALASAVRWKILTENVCDDVDLPGQDRPHVQAWTIEEARTFTREVRGHRFEAAYLLLIHAGLRIGEALAVRWTDLDPADSTVTVRQAEWTAAKRVIGLPKFGSAGVVDVDGRVMARLMELRVQQSERSPYVLGKSGETRWSYDTVLDDWSALCVKAGVRRVPLHAGRHSFATAHMVAGTDLADLAVLMRHRNPAVTAATYLSPSQQRRKAAASRLGDLFSDDSGTNGAPGGAQSAC